MPRMKTTSRVNVSEEAFYVSTRILRSLQGSEDGESACHRAGNIA
jgi:hypothetical protein